MGRAGWVVAVVVMLSACGGGGPSTRDYAVPQDFCGLEIATALYDPLFPPGSELERRGDFDGVIPVYRTCSYRVDGEVAVVVGTQAGDNVDWFISLRELDYSMDEARTVEGEYETLVWSDFAVAHAPCTVENGESSIIDAFMVGVQAQNPGDSEDLERVLVEFVQALEGALLEQMPCAEYSDE